MELSEYSENDETPGDSANATDDASRLDRLAALRRRVLDEAGRAIVGQSDVLEELLISLFAGGHALLVGVPGLAKTLMVRTLAETLGLSFNRVQFTPDLMPADITGTEVLQEDRASGTREFRFVPGPVFAQIVLADEINRTPPKTQAALLEAMQEHQVTAAGHRHPLPSPFYVLATQNPIEQEGTYPLPEAQLDRFLMQIRVPYPAEDDELAIVRQTTRDEPPVIQPQTSAEELLELRGVVRRIITPDDVLRFALAIVRQSRVSEPSAAEPVRRYVAWGAGPRASQALVLCAKARAACAGREYASIEDVRAVAAPVLRHRILLNFQAQADGVRPEDLIAQLVASAEQRAGAATPAKAWFPGLVRPAGA